MRSACLDEKLASPAMRPARAWREIELLVLAVLVVAIYFTRLTDLTIRGEEPRWARVAQEMLDSGDWIVPRQQGQPFPDRPPLNSWAIIAASHATGGLNLAAIRLPSALATLLVTLLVYLYGRNFLSRPGAFAAAAAFCTTGMVLHLGRLAESDALLTLCLTGALFSWHYGYACRRDPRLAWLAGYALAGLAALAKGPQGPVYFVAIAVVFLARQRDWRFLLGRWHLAGLAVFTVVVGSWYLPFVLALDWSMAVQVWTEEGNMASRFRPDSLSRALSHWVSFPVEVFGSMLPWSCMWPVLATRWFRRKIGAARPLVHFVTIACAVTLPTCWLPIESRARYWMALCPCTALLVGLAVQRSLEARQIGWWRRSWDQFLMTGLGFIVGAPLLLGAMHVFGGARLHGLGQSVSSSFVVLYLAAAAAAALAALWSRRGRTAWRAELGMLALAGFLGLTYTGVVISVQDRTSNDPSAAVASVRDAVPPGERLVSFGHVHHLFAYYYRQPIEFEPLDDHVAPEDSRATYFCFAVDPGFQAPTIPFAWEQVAEISCDRARTDKPRARVIVGRRVALVAVRVDSAAQSVSPAAHVERGDRAIRR